MKIDTNKLGHMTNMALQTLQKSSSPEPIDQWP